MNLKQFKRRSTNRAFNGEARILIFDGVRYERYGDTGDEIYSSEGDAADRGGRKNPCSG